jgi:5'-methylthioadenosine phosphorylase
MEWGFIGGTGFCTVDDAGEPQAVETPYGQAVVYPVEMGGQQVAFLPRHGTKHGIPPHLINYRANIWALRELGVRRVLATASVGSLNANMQPGEYVVLTQFLDFTKGRPSTFFQEGGEGVHPDMTEPYCTALRQQLVHGAAELGRWLHPAGTYVCTEGPRFETAAEVTMFSQLGGDVVGMTGVPEAVLAREAGLCYATLAVVTNWAAAVGGAPLTHEEVSTEMARQIAAVKQVFREVVCQGQQGGCSCRRVTEDDG